MTILDNEPTWSAVSLGSQTAYSRPLLGSELFMNQMSVFVNGLADCCMGVSFTSTLSQEQMISRVTYAIGRLRFVSPIIASSLRGNIHDPQLLSWVYFPLQNTDELKDWLDQAVVIVIDDSDPGEFPGQAILEKMPHKHHGGTELIFRCYLLKSSTDDTQYSIYFHGPHSIMDGRPVLNAISLTLEWMTESNPPPLEALKWGTEWANLPPGPVTATGGPRESWEKDGAPVLGKIKEMVMDPTPTHSLKFHPNDHSTGKQFIERATIGRDDSARILKQLKALHLTATQLFDAAQILATFSLNPVPDEASSGVHFTYRMAFLSLARSHVVPYNTRANFISSSAILPFRVTYDDIRNFDNPRDRLIGAMRILKGQYDNYLANPHFPHLTAAMMTVAPPRKPVERPNPYAAVVNNIGVLEQILPFTYFVDNDSAKSQLFEVQTLHVRHRLPTPVLFNHVWTQASEIHWQIQASDIWDKEFLKEYINEIVQQMLSILE